jgi:hypothetical protein
MNGKFRLCISAWTITSFLIVSGRCLSSEDTAASESPQVSLPWHKASITVGGCLSALDSSLGFGLKGVGLTVNPEKLLGLDSSLAVFRAGALYRPGKTLRNQLDFAYAAYNRSGGRDAVPRDYHRRHHVSGRGACRLAF